MKVYKYKYVKSAVLITIAYSLFSVAMSYAISLLVVQNINQLARNVILVLLVYLLHSLFLFWQLRSTAKAEAYIQQVLAQNLDNYFASMNFEVFHEINHGERLSSYINDIPKVIELTLDKLLSRVKFFTIALGSFLALVNIHYSMGILALGAFIVMALVPRLFQKRLRNFIEGLQTEKATYTSKMRELLEGFTTFFEQQAFSVFYKKSYAANQKLASYQIGMQTFTAYMSSCLTLVNGLVSVIAVACLSYFVILGRVQAGALLAVVSLIPNFGSSVIQFLSEGEFYKSGQSLFKEKFLFASDGIKLLSPSNISSNHESEQIQISDSIVLESIELPYGQGINFPNITLNINKKYAIMGESGSGKSSLLKVLIGEISNYSGRVKIDSQLKSPEKNLFDQISYVNQQTFLFNDSIKNNIDFFNEMTDDAVQELLNQVGLSNLLPEMVLTDNGKNLSGGQRQRIALARALARKKEILVLDEATANLDAATSQYIEELAVNSAGTVIMITHRMTKKLQEKLDGVIKLEETHGTGNDVT